MWTFEGAQPDQCGSLGDGFQPGPRKVCLSVVIGNRVRVQIQQRVDVIWRKCLGVDFNWEDFASQKHLHLYMHMEFEAGIWSSSVVLFTHLFSLFLLLWNCLYVSCFSHYVLSFQWLRWLVKREHTISRAFSSGTRAASQWKPIPFASLLTRAHRVLVKSSALWK